MHFQWRCHDPYLSWGYRYQNFRQHTFKAVYERMIVQNVWLVSVWTLGVNDIQFVKICSVTRTLRYEMDFHSARNSYINVLFLTQNEANSGILLTWFLTAHSFLVFRWSPSRQEDATARLLGCSRILGPTYRWQYNHLRWNCPSTLVSSLPARSKLHSRHRIWLARFSIINMY